MMEFKVYYVSFIFVINILKVRSVEMLPYETLTITEKHLLQCVMGIASRHFNQHETVTVLPTKEDEKLFTPERNVRNLKESLMQELHYSNNFTYWFGPLHDWTAKRNDTTSGSAVVLIQETVSGNVLTYLTHLLARLLWKDWDPRGKFVIVMVNHFGYPTDFWAELLLTIAWRAEVVNAIVVIPNLFDTDLLDIYGWLPDDQDNLCFKIVTNVTLFDLWESQQLRFKNNNELYPSKQVKDMRGCSVNCFLMGIGKKLFIDNRNAPLGSASVALIMISNLTNFETKLVWGKYYGKCQREFDTSTNIVGLVDVRKRRPTRQVLEYSYPVTKQAFTWLVPVGVPVPRWQGLIRIFSPPMWIFIVITFSLATISLWIQRIRQTSTQKFSFISCFLIVLQLHLAIAICRIPKGILSNFIFVLCLFYCLQVYTAYQSALISFLANPGRYPPIKNRVELESSGIELTSLLYNPAHTKVSGVVRPKEAVSMAANLSYVANRLFCDGDIAIATALDAFQFIALETDIRCYPQYVALEDPFYEALFGYGFTRGSILFERFNTLLLRIIDFGIIIKFDNVFHRLIRVKDQDFVKAYVMTMSHLQGAFYLLLLGLCLSVLVLIVEGVYYQCTVIRS